ncbi:MAG: NAD-dependent epimerase/dehydratase family protein [Planctomycetes bacterium]|nr:NAD-dependent epimerase/dehydratase family protein [Planctomycetota bacterium]
MARKTRFLNILVTGGAGFIGSNLVQAIQARWPSALLTVVDDFRSGHFKNLTGFRGDVVAADIGAWESSEKYDCIFHLASITDTTISDQFRMVRDNVEGFRSVLRMARRMKAIVVYASSAATYGQANERALETSPALPTTAYAFSKVVLDHLAERARWDGMRVEGVRYFNVYGPHEAHKGAAASMIYQLAAQMRKDRRPRIFKHGEQRRDFIFVDDAVHATLLAAERGKNAVYNVGTGRARSFNEVIDALNSALGTRLEPEYFDNPYDFYQDYTEANIARARADLGFTAAFGLEDGVREYLQRLGWTRAAHRLLQ